MNMKKMCINAIQLSRLSQYKYVLVLKNKLNGAKLMN